MKKKNKNNELLNNKKKIIKLNVWEKKKLLIF